MLDRLSSSIQELDQGVTMQPRFIPAPAGNGGPFTMTRRSSSVHPRACGERVTCRASHRKSNGSSPRLRGTARTGDQSLDVQRFIPAPAGNGLLFQFPSEMSYGSSPRLRGTGVQPLRKMAIYRFIPAPAGNGLALGGLHDDSNGSSPRLRGTANSQQDPFCNLRFIPAPAGNG